MPCYLTGSLEGDLRLETSEAREQATLMTRRACAALEILTREGLLNELPSDVRDWWKKHQAIDLERKTREREQERIDEIARQAIAKLNEEEQRALGLKR